MKRLKDFLGVLWLAFCIFLLAVFIIGASVGITWVTYKMLLWMFGPYEAS